MKAIILLAHGNHKDGTLHNLNAYVEVLKNLLQTPYIEKAFLEGDGASLEEAVEALLPEGMTKLTLLPFFLNEGYYTEVKIPKEVQNLQEIYKDLKVTVAKPLLFDEKIAEVLVKRLKEIP